METDRDLESLIPREKKASFPEVHGTLKQLDLILGLFSTLLLGLCAHDYFRGIVGPNALIWMAVFFISNMALSQFSMRMKSPLVIEIIRIFPMGLISCFLVHYYGHNTYTWSVFLVMSLGCASDLLFATGKPRWAYSQVAFWIVIFGLSNWFKVGGLSSIEFISTAGMIVMTSTLLIATMTFLIAGIEREKIVKMQMIVTSKMSALGEMAGGVAHEINNPLAIIKLYAGQLRDMAEDDVIDRPVLIETLTNVEDTVDRIAKIVRGLKSFSRDGSKDAVAAVHVAQLLRDALSFCSERFKHHQIDLRYAGVSDEIVFQGREVEISQVVLNLLNNAHDAVLPLKERWIELAVNEDPEHIEISITDSGTGIPEKIRTKLFQPFFTTKEVGQGTGLGLSISSGLVQAHRGTLFVDPDCANTRLVIKLPKHHEQSATVEAA